MKLTGILKDKVDKAETMEAKKNIIADAGMELTDDELEGVVGGKGRRLQMQVNCFKCNWDNYIDINKSDFTCCKCGILNRIME